MLHAYEGMSAGVELDLDFLLHNATAVTDNPCVALTQKYSVYTYISMQVCDIELPRDG